MKNLVLLLFMLFGNMVHAVTIEKLIADGTLKVDLTAEKTSNYYVGQPIALSVNIHFYRWFAKGSRLSLPTVDNAIVQQASQFATNYSEKINGDTWTTQQWHLRLYPRKPGLISIPGIVVQLSLNDENGIVEGQYVTNPISFNVADLPISDTPKNWIATEDYTLTASLEGVKDTYAPGDAIIRTIRQTATNTPAMMLSPPKIGDIAGLAIYREQPIIKDNANRGELQGERIDRVIYTIERPGTYQLPVHSFYWWDFNNEVLHEETTESVKISAGPTSPLAFSLPTNKTVLTSALLWLSILALLAAILYIFINYIKNRTKLAPKEETLFIKAIHNQDYKLALNSLYRIAFSRGKLTLEQAYDADDQCASICRRLVVLATHHPHSTDVAGTISINQAKLLLSRKNPVKWPPNWYKAAEITLNPAPSNNRNNPWVSQ